MIEELIAQNYVVLTTKALVSQVRAISQQAYAVIVDRNEAPVAVATRRDVVSLAQPGDVQLVEVVSHLPHALVAGRGIAIERLVKAATASPEMFGRGTVLLRGREVAGVLPVRNMVSYLRTQGTGFAPTIARLNSASMRIGGSLRGIEPPGTIESPRPVTVEDCPLWVVCAVCGHLNCLESIPDEDDDMPMCGSPDPPPHRIGRG
jgi:hypothetical protein